MSTVILGHAREQCAAMEEFFGNDDQRALLRRGRRMADALQSDQRYSYYGGTVGLVSPDECDIDQLAALAAVQGNSNSSAVPLNEAATVERALEARGLVPVHYAKWEGADTTLAAARQVVDTMSLPDDVTVVRMDASTPEHHMTSFEKMALGCGVLPLCGEVLRGLLGPAMCFVALDRDDIVAACAAASSFARKDHPAFGNQAWWGMLATDPARRGERLALILGARAVREVEARFGLRDFMTGVEPGNAPSEAVCTRMGLSSGKFAIIGCADPQALASGRVTNRV